MTEGFAGLSNSYLVKTRTGQFSRDPLNLKNVHSRKVRLENSNFGK